MRSWWSRRMNHAKWHAASKQEFPFKVCREICSRCLGALIRARLFTIEWNGIYGINVRVKNYRLFPPFNENLFSFRAIQHDASHSTCAHIAQYFNRTYFYAGWSAYTVYRRVFSFITRAVKALRDSVLAYTFQPVHPILLGVSHSVGPTILLISPEAHLCHRNPHQPICLRRSLDWLNVQLTHCYDHP